MSAMPNELRSAPVNSGSAEDPCGSCRSVQCVGQELRAAERCLGGGLNDSEISTASGKQAPDQDRRCRPTVHQRLVLAAASAVHPSTCARSILKHLDEDEGDQHAPMRNSSTEPPSPRPSLHQRRRSAGRPGTTSVSVLLAPVGHDEDVVEDAPRVQRAEQQRHHDRRLHVRQRHLPQPLPRVAPSTFAASGMSSGTCDQPGQQQQRDERRGLPDLGQADRRTAPTSGRRTS